MADTFIYSNFGPLTTSFSAPADCSTEKWLGFNSPTTKLAWAEDCAGVIASCYPQLRTHDGTSLDINQNANLVRNLAYEPGLFCPAGFSAALVLTAGATSTPEGFRLYVRTLRTSSVATACCPSGYFWSSPGCFSLATSLDSRPALMSSAGMCTTSAIPEFTGSIGTHTSTIARLEATPVMLIRDLRSSYNIPTSTSTSTSTSALSNTTSNGNSAGSGSDSDSDSDSDSGSTGGGLSTGAKIAIGICIPVAVLLFAAALFIWRHRRKRSRNARWMARPAHVAELDTGAIELQGGSTERSYRTAELDQRKDTTYSELPAEIGEFTFHDKDNSGGQKEADEVKDDFERQTEADEGKDELQRETDVDADNTHAPRDFLNKA